MSLRERNTQLDVLKGLLVIAMITAHMNNVWSLDVPVMNHVANLTAFSGFMFCFGFVSQIAYFSQPRLDYRRIASTIYRPLLAFYVSGIFIETVIVGHALDLEAYFKILTLSTLPTHSEFLPAFSLVMLAAVLFVKPLRWVVASPVRVVIACCLLALTAFFPYDLVRSPQLGLLVGAPESVATVYPILQYFVFFLIGMAFAHYRVRDQLWLKLVGGLGLIAVAGYVARFDFPQRFPPVFGWIVGGIPLVFLAYWFSGILNRAALVRRILVPVGENTLLYLVLSNGVLFGLMPILRDNVTRLQALPLLLFVFGSIFYLATIVRRPKTTVLTAQQQAP